MNGVPTVAVADLPADAPLLDVREADEWAAGHAPTARTCRCPSWWRGSTSCPTTTRSTSSAAPAAARPGSSPTSPAQGYPAVNVDGGMQAWSAQGRDVVADAGAPADPLTVVCRARRDAVPALRARVRRRRRARSARTAGATSRAAVGRRAAAVGRRRPAAPACRTRYVGPPRYRQRRRAGASPAGAVAAGAAARPAPRSRRSSGPARSPRSRSRCCGRSAAVALLAAGAETWRYVLLLASREGALSADAVAASDALVLAAGTGTVLLGLAAGGFVVALVAAAAAVAAAARSGSRPSRSCARDRARAGSCPGWNLARGRARCSPRSSTGRWTAHPDRRPQPSRLLARLVAAVGGRGRARGRSCWPGRGAPACRPGRTASCCTPCWTCSPPSRPGSTAVLVGRLTALLDPVRAPRRRLLLAVGDRPRAALNADARARSGRHPQLPQPPHDEVRPSPRRRRERHPRQAAAQRVQHRRHLEPGQRRAQAVVHARRRTRGAGCGRRPTSSSVGSVEDLRVVRRGAEQRGDLRARRDRVPGDGRCRARPCARTAAAAGRSGSAPRRPWRRAPGRPRSRRHCSGWREQREHAVADDVDGRLVAGHQQQRGGADQLVGQPLRQPSASRSARPGRSPGRRRGARGGGRPARAGRRRTPRTPSPRRARRPSPGSGSYIATIAVDQPRSRGRTAVRHPEQLGDHLDRQHVRDAGHQVGRAGVPRPGRRARRRAGRPARAPRAPAGRCARG